MSSESKPSDHSYEEMLARWREYEEARARLELENAASDVDRFTRLAASHGIKLNPESFKYNPRIGVVAKAPSLAKTLLADIPRDKDGLYLYNDILLQLPGRHFQAGYFVGTDYIVMAHPCFRRQMHPQANWAPRFIELFWSLDSPSIEKFIAIDADRVRVNVDSYGYYEADTWFGAPFNEDVGAIQPGIVKLRPPMDIGATYIDFFFAKNYCLDIKWFDEGNIKTFQALELKTEDVRIDLDGVTYFPARYLHAQFDTAIGSFRHFDGAIQFFLEDEYLRRRDGDFNIGAKDQKHVKARSEKVFKLNGRLHTDKWVELCCHFFAGNPLTFEYFTGSYPEHVNDAVSKLRSRSDNA